jgi:hypothetical protein
MTKSTTSPLPTDRLKNTLEEVRASMVAQGANKGLAGVLQEAMLSFLNLLMAMLADFRAGRLVALAPSPREEEASDSDVDAADRTSPRPSPQSGEGANGTAGARWLGLWGWWRKIPARSEVRRGSKRSGC